MSTSSPRLLRIGSRQTADTSTPRGAKRLFIDPTSHDEPKLMHPYLGATLGSPLLRFKNPETNLNASIAETDSVISSCMLTSGSVYDLLDPANERCFTSIETGYSTADESGRSIHSTTTKPSVDALHAQATADSSLKLRNRDVNWGDRSSLCLSIEYPKSIALNYSPGGLYKSGNSRNYFKICFATELSSDDDDENVSLKSFSPCGLVTFEEEEVRAGTISPTSQCSTPKIGVIETADGLFTKASLEGLNIAQLQLIVNDLLSQIDDNNLILIEQLPLRDELKIERRQKEATIDDYAFKRSPPSTQALRPQSNWPPSLKLSSDAFNPNPEQRSPFFMVHTPPRHLNASSMVAPSSSPNCNSSTSPTHGVGTRLKSYFGKFFSARRQCQQTSTNLKSSSF